MCRLSRAPLCCRRRGPRRGPKRPLCAAGRAPSIYERRPRRPPPDAARKTQAMDTAPIKKTAVMMLLRGMNGRKPMPAQREIAIRADANKAQAGIGLGRSLPNLSVISVACPAGSAARGAVALAIRLHAALSAALRMARRLLPGPGKRHRCSCSPGSLGSAVSGSRVRAPGSGPPR